MRAVLGVLVAVCTSHEHRASSFSLGRTARLGLSVKTIPSLRQRVSTPTTGSPLRAVQTRFSRNETMSGGPRMRELAQDPRRRFDRTADKSAVADVDIVLTIHNRQYNLTKWAKAHPGGFDALDKFKSRDATKAFESAHHSARARALLERFAVEDRTSPVATPVVAAPKMTVCPIKAARAQESMVSHAKRKLFTKEDPVGIHKYLGIFCLLNFMYRFAQMLFFDPTAGLGSRPLHSASGWIAPLCLLPHAALSVSSLMFRTVPKDRVVGKPMIWQEYRIHNIAFGLRSVVSSLLCHLSIRMHHQPSWRRFAVAASGLAVLVTQLVADWGSRNFRASENESTTASTPYWEGCSIETEKRFKSFYAYCQFMATLVCLAVLNPAWPFAVLLAIQCASLLLTLVRKGLLSARGFHYGYTFTLLLPYAVALRSTYITSRPEFLAMLAVGAVLFELRRRGTNKYVLWVPVIAARVAIGDRFLGYDMW